MKRIYVLLSIVLVLVISGCGGNNVEKKPSDPSGHGGHAGMDHSSSGEIPEGMKTAVNPKFAIGSKAVITEAHMDGMNGAESTIVEAFDTTVYAVSYTPTTGGERVTNHKWIVHEEIQNADSTPYEPGAEVVLQADHMEGMEGATAIIDSAEQTTVYMVDFTTTDGEQVKNHQWVTESELKEIQ